MRRKRKSNDVKTVLIPIELIKKLKIPPNCPLHKKPMIELGIIVCKGGIEFTVFYCMRCGIEIYIPKQIIDAWIENIGEK